MLINDAAEEHEGTELITEFLQKPLYCLPVATEAQIAKHRARIQLIDRIQNAGGISCYLKTIQSDPTEAALAQELMGNSPIYERKLYRIMEKKDSFFDLVRGPGGIGKAPRIGNWVFAMILEELSIAPGAKASSIHVKLEKFAAAEGLKLPSYKQVLRLRNLCVASGGISDVLVALSRRKYHAKFGQARKRIYHYANEVWETDATSLGIRVILEDGSSFVPEVILTIDCFTGCPIGWSLPEPRIAGSGNLTNKANTNDMLDHLRFTVSTLTKPMGGIPKIFYSDNGSCMISQGLRVALENLGTTPSSTPPYSPSADGMVERLNQTTKDRFKAMFGQFYSKKFKYDNEMPRIMASVETIRAMFDAFMRHYFSTHVRKGEKQTVSASWFNQVKDKRMAYSEGLLNRECMHHGKGEYTREGILIAGLRFADPKMRIPVMSNGRPLRLPFRTDNINDPKIVITAYGGEEIELKLNAIDARKAIKAMTSPMELKKEELQEFGEIVHASAIRNSDFHSPFRSLTEQAKKEQAEIQERAERRAKRDAAAKGMKSPKTKRGVPRAKRAREGAHLTPCAYVEFTKI